MYSSRFRPLLGAGILFVVGLYAGCENQVTDPLLNPGNVQLNQSGNGDPSNDPNSLGGDPSADPNGNSAGGVSPSSGSSGGDPGNPGSSDPGGEQGGGGNNNPNVVAVDTRPVTMVTSLDDTEMYETLVVGSLRWALANAPTPGIIRFEVGGVIKLREWLTVERSDLEIDGSTAPGGGITIVGRQFSVRDAHDVVIRNLRFRSGDGFASDSERIAAHGQYFDVTNPNFSGGQRSLVVCGEHGPCRRVRIVNCSIQNSTDDNGVVSGDCAEISFYRCLFSGGYTQYTKGLSCHGIPGGHPPSHPNWVTVQQCLFVNQWARMPDMAGETVHLVNNVILRPMQGGRLSYAKANVVGNCLFNLPNHPRGPMVERVLTMLNGTFSNGALFVSGNLVDGLFSDSTAVGITNQGPAPLPSGTYRSEPFPELPTGIVSAPQALLEVLTNAGCRGPGRDQIDLTEIDRAAGFVGINPALVQ